MNFFNGVLPTLLEDHLVNYENAMIAFLEGDGDAFVENFQSFMIGGSYAIIVSVLSIAGAAILIYTATKRLIYVKDAPEASIPVGKLGVVLFTSIGTILFLIFSAYSIVSQYLPF